MRGKSAVGRGQRRYADAGECERDDEGSKQPNAADAAIPFRSDDVDYAGSGAFDPVLDRVELQLAMEDGLRAVGAADFELCRLCRHNGQQRYEPNSYT